MRESQALDRQIETRQIAGLFALSAASLVCRLLMVRLSGRCTIAIGFDATLPCLALCAIVLGFSLLLGYRKLAGLSLGLAIFSISFTYLFDAVEAAIHFGRSFPYADDALAKADRLLGFDWLAYAQWMDGHDLLWSAARLAYLSMPLVAFAVIFVLAMSESTARLVTYFLVQIACLGIVACVGAMMPALGAYETTRAAALAFRHHDFVTADHMTASLAWLRQETLTGDGVTYHGLVSFPSYHAMSCAIYVWALWQNRWLRWPTVAWNALILAATPVQGSHYLVDIVVGLVIAGLVIKACQALVDLMSRPAKAGAIAGGGRAGACEPVASQRAFFTRYSTKPGRLSSSSSASGTGSPVGSPSR